MEDIKKEVELYPYIRELLRKKYIKLLQNEINFLEQLKAVDLFGMDKKYYYIIEVKKDFIREDDYYNLIYIINNNSLDKPIKGILIGQCRDLKLYDMISKNNNIELIWIDIKDDIIINESRKIENSNTYLNKYGYRYLRHMFEGVADEDITYMSINEKSITAKYTFQNTTVGFRLEDSGRGKKNVLWGKMYIDKYDCDLDKWITIFCDRVSQNGVRNQLYKAKLQSAYKGARSSIYNLMDLRDIYGSAFVLFKYINIGTLVWEWNTKLNINNKGDGIELVKLNESWKNAVWCNPKYAELIKMYEFDNSIRDNYTEYNKINYYESINIIINNKLLQPVKQIVYNSNKSTIILIMKFIDNNKKEQILNKEYKVDTFRGITEVDFYLICNIDIIMDFEECVLDKINNYNWVIDEEQDYIYNYLRDKIINKFQDKGISIKTMRECITTFEKKHGRLRY